MAEITISGSGVILVGGGKVSMKTSDKETTMVVSSGDFTLLSTNDRVTFSKDGKTIKIADEGRAITYRD